MCVLGKGGNIQRVHMDNGQKRSTTAVIVIVAEATAAILVSQQEQVSKGN